MYLTATRSDIMFRVSLISRYMLAPAEEHWCAAKRILRYINGTIEMGILYKGESIIEFVAYTDSDFAGDLNDRKSTSGFVFLLAEGAVSWALKKQRVVTLSTNEAEYIVTASCACQYIWLMRLLKKLGHKVEEHSLMYCDNSSTIQLSKHFVFHGKSKHINVKFYFLRGLVNEGTVKLKYCNTQNQIADIMTKQLKKEQFIKLREMLGLMSAIEVSGFTYSIQLKGEIDGLIILLDGHILL